MSKINQYINNISRVEFSITYSCTSNCKHCSNGKNKGRDKLDKLVACNGLIDLANEFQIESVMTFGGEPLLFSDTTFAIHKTAKVYGVPVRQIITNGYFTDDEKKIRICTKELAESGINDLLLSVDCFHQEYIPIDKIFKFVSFLKKDYRGRLRLHPAWVVNECDDNPYNRSTKEYLSYFQDMGLKCSRGNNIFAAGNALKYLSEYLDKKPIDINFKCGQAPYTADLECVNGISINPNGDVMVCSFPIGNINRNNILDILADYNPYKNPYTNALLKGGIKQLVEYLKGEGEIITLSDYYSPCDICRDVAKRFN